MDTPELFPGEAAVREKVLGAGWWETVGNGWALLFESLEGADLTLRVYPSFFLEDVMPVFLLVETLDRDPVRAPVGLQLWVKAKGGYPPAPQQAAALLGKYGVVCRVDDLMPEDLTVEVW